jgi:Pentapeptide repeats (8 copies)
MANQKHLDVLKMGVTAWNKWREENPGLRPDLSGALVNAPLIGDWNSKEARQLRELKYLSVDVAPRQTGRLFLPQPNFGGADLSRADFSGVTSNSQASKARISVTQISGMPTSWRQTSQGPWANLGEANLREANLASADLTGCQLVQTNLKRANLSGCRVYGISAWDVRLDEATKQENLVITPKGESAITVDNIKVAQFIYLLLNNQEIRDAIDTITSKAVLILGRFSGERKPALDALRDELRKPEHNYLPIMFDFSPSANQTTIETIKTLASMARFVVADLIGHG